MVVSGGAVVALVIPNPWRVIVVRAVSWIVTVVMIVVMRTMVVPVVIVPIMVAIPRFRLRDDAGETGEHEEGEE